MKQKIFFSWQSDIKGSKSRLSSILSTAIKKVNRYDFEFNVALDRDTYGKTGAIPIANTIFAKINQANIFIADITLIYSTSKFRNTPNPNVLVELGYAVGILGWEKIILLFDEGNGKFENVPFDLRDRRILKFNSKVLNKDTFTDKIQNIIIKITKETTDSNILGNYLKSKIDFLILEIYAHIAKLYHDYNYNCPVIPKETYLFLKKINKDLLKRKLKENLVCKFNVYRSYDPYREKLDELILVLMNDKRFSQAITSCLAQLNWKLFNFDMLTRHSYAKKRFGLKKGAKPNILEEHKLKVASRGNQMFEIRSIIGKGYSKLEVIPKTHWLSKENLFDIYELRTSGRLVDRIFDIKELILEWFRLTGEYSIRGDGSKLLLRKDQS